jgi:hypothetical protein
MSIIRQVAEEQTPMKEALERYIKTLGIVDVKCPCCGEETSTGSAINDPDDEFWDIVT